MIVTCVECGKIEDLSRWYGMKRAEVKKLCFTCNFWDERLEHISDLNVAVVDGHWYAYGAENESFKGFAGRKFVIRFNSGRVVTTTNLWHGGEIAENFRNRMPDNAVFETGQRWAKCADGTAAMSES